jgi:glycosyltransferase A (GT-A) superfamily protein (DUF2064 family)
MATEIVIEADEVELIPVTLIGVKYLVNPPKTALTMNLAKGIGGKKAAKIQALPANPTADQVAAHKAAKDAALEEQRKSASQSMDGIQSWIKQAFGKETAKAINKRLEDPEDKLDYPHLTKLMIQLAEATTGDPST